MPRCLSDDDPKPVLEIAAIVNNNSLSWLAFTLLSVIHLSSFRAYKEEERATRANTPIRRFVQVRLWLKYFRKGVYHDNEEHRQMIWMGQCEARKAPLQTHDETSPDGFSEEALFFSIKSCGSMFYIQLLPRTFTFFSERHPSTSKPQSLKASC